MTATTEMLTPQEQEALTSDTAIMTIEEVAADTKLGVPTIYELMRGGSFPKNFNLWGRKFVWLKSEVEAWKRWRIDLGKGDGRWQPPAE